MPIDHHKAFAAILGQMQARTPGLRIAWKSESAIQKLVGFFVHSFAPEYLTSFATTWGRTIYLPSPEWAAAEPLGAWQTLCHEYVHVRDYVRAPWRFVLGYAFPKGLALLALLAPLGLLAWPLWFLATFLLALVPWPSPWRARSELRAYEVSLLSEWWSNTGPAYEDLTYFARVYSHAYYMSQPTQDDALNALSAFVQAIQKAGPGADVLPAGDDRRAIYDIMRAASAVEAGR